MKIGHVHVPCIGDESNAAIYGIALKDLETVPAEAMTFTSVARPSSGRLPVADRLFVQVWDDSYEIRAAWKRVSDPSV
jgi:hypothetical protein